MFKYLYSIRHKISLGYYVIVVTIVGMSIFTFLELRVVGEQIRLGEGISEFFDATLEIRRFEKNYFLYGQRSDYDENLTYVDKAGELLERFGTGPRTVILPEQLAAFRNHLQQYKELMARYAAYPEKSVARYALERTGLEEEIRKTGKDMVTLAEAIRRTERKNLQEILYRKRNVLIASIISLSIIGILIGQVISRIVAKPLKSLEARMEDIADGKFQKVQIHSRDREIVSLTNAVNKMLMELELRQAHLIQSEKLASLGTLLSGVAHELNNPLSNISSSTQILLEELEDPDILFKKELLAQTTEQTDRARDIVRSLLEFSRGKDKDTSKQLVPLRKALEETIRFLRGQVRTEIEIRMDVPDDLVIFANKQRIQQAFLNLIKNAVESIPDEGGVFITARHHRVSDRTGENAAVVPGHVKYHGHCTFDADTVDIEIKDTGSGMPPDLLSKIFDPFFTTKDVGKGTGLGLFIVYEIIEECGGCIAVDSKMGIGTKFLMRLPAEG